MPEPSPNGQFQKGNPGGPGNPHAGRVSKLRAALIAAVTAEDIAAVVKSIVQAAKSGDIPAAKLLFDRVLGKPGAGDDEQEPGRNRVLSFLSEGRVSAAEILKEIQREASGHAEPWQGDD